MVAFGCFVLIVVGLLALIVLCISGYLRDSNPVYRVLLYVDMFFCALLLGNPDMTISARCGLALRAGHPHLLCALGHVLNSISNNHCKRAIADDIARAKRALEILES